MEEGSRENERLGGMIKFSSIGLEIKLEQLTLTINKQDLLYKLELLTLGVRSV